MKNRTDKVTRRNAHDNEWKPKSDCRKKLHRLANKRVRRLPIDDEKT